MGLVLHVSVNAQKLAITTVQGVIIKKVKSFIISNIFCGWVGNCFTREQEASGNATLCDQGGHHDGTDCIIAIALMKNWEYGRHSLYGYEYCMWFIMYLPQGFKKT